MNSIVGPHTNTFILLYMHMHKYLYFKMQTNRAFVWVWVSVRGFYGSQSYRVLWLSSCISPICPSVAVATGSVGTSEQRLRSSAAFSSESWSFRSKRLARGLEPQWGLLPTMLLHQSRACHWVSQHARSLLNIHDSCCSVSQTWERRRHHTQKFRIVIFFFQTLIVLAHMW